MLIGESKQKSASHDNSPGNAVWMGCCCHHWREGNIRDMTVRMLPSGLLRGLMWSCCSLIQTSKILLHSHVWINHKWLLTVLNKVDQVKKVSMVVCVLFEVTLLDPLHLVQWPNAFISLSFFLILDSRLACVHGSLCWNLSTQKNYQESLPCVCWRKEEVALLLLLLGINTQLVQNPPPLEPPTCQFAPSMWWCHGWGNDVPKQWIGNVLTNLNDPIHFLLIHALIVEKRKKMYAKRVWEQWLQMGSMMCGGVGTIKLNLCF